MISERQTDSNEAFPIAETEVLSARKYGMSLWGNTATIYTKLPDGAEKTYFLKVGDCPLTASSRNFH